jgi:glucose/arabinose dehydrogenase
MKTLFSLVCAIFLYGQVFAQTLPSGFFMTDVNDVNWPQPVGAVFSTDGLKLFVWEKSGKVYVNNRVGTDYVKQSTPVIDLSAEVLNDRDFGLLGFALDPEFSSNGYIYLLYVVDRRFLMNNNTTPDDINEATIGRLTKYQTEMSGGNMIAKLSTRKILIGETKSTGFPILYESHGIGSLAFAADGTLLVTCGDGASYSATDGGSVSHTYYQQALNDGIIRPEENVGSFRSQMLNSHSGKLLRINPENGDGLPSNPFYDAENPKSPKSRVWALGLRNPFRMSVKPGSGSTNPSAGDIGEVFIGDVGYTTWEELNIVKAPGMNFGWPLYEGQTPHTGYTALNTQNKDEPNTFGPCNGRDFFRFKDLLRQDNAQKDNHVYNACNNTQLIGSGNRFIHARPAIDWKHGSLPSDNIARVGRFDANGIAISPTIGTAASEVNGVPFRGNCTAGGIWYTGAGNSFPPEYKNTFLGVDYNTNWLRRFSIDFTDVVTKVDAFGTNMGSVVCLVENPLDGTLVCVNVGSSATNGTVKKMSYGGNIPPVAKINADKYYSPDASFTVNFDGTESSDQDGSISTYSWNFGDPGSPGGNTSTSPTPSHTFVSATGSKKFIVQLTVTDNSGSSSIRQLIVSAANTPPVVNITSPIKNSKYKVAADSVYELSAIVEDVEHSSGQLTYEWQTALVHNDHQHPQAIDPKQETDARITRIGCIDDYHWLITLNVIDPAGLSTSDSSRIYPDCAGTLPIFLHKFSVTQNGTVNLVKWTTELESNIEYFELERSTNGINFQPINRQPASNIPGTSQYSFADNSFSQGLNYYRLKIVEHGDIIRYSVVIRTVSETEDNQLRIAPNPVAGNFSLTYFAAEEDKVTIEINDVTGRLIHTVKEGANKGQNVIYIQSSPDWLAGVYVLTVKGKNDTKQVKFIKIH